MADTVMAHDPEAVAVLPYMMSGATDAKYLSKIGVPTYGFSPLQLPNGMPFMEMFHAHDERVPVEAWGGGDTCCTKWSSNTAVSAASEGSRRGHAALLHTSTGPDGGV